ncbi:MAG TPA: tetratricopeptide repeat protein [Haliangiales bacterium]|nr:tetratricopeptide repeat protein [Haliangiales bacterium]
MIRGVVLLLILGLCAPAGAAARARKVVVILPPAAAGDGADLALVMQTRAAALLARTGGFQDVHLKQILRVAEHEGLSRAALATADGAAVLARRFGAERAVYATFAKEGDGWVLTAAATGGRAETKTKLAAAPARAVQDGAAALARLAAGAQVDAGRPATTSDAAVAAYARCYARIVAQPLLVGTPMVLDEAELGQAMEACRAAVAADPRFHDARAALGLALALSGQDADAVQALAQVPEDAGYLPLYWLARYWLVTRYQSVDAGATALKKSIERHPYFLLARGYLAQHEHALHHDAAALEAWRAYRTELPGSAFVRGGLSHSLARLGRHDEAIAEARAAVADAPDDREAKLELASRHIDAGHFSEAVAVLAPLATAAGARGETMLRLGFAYARQGDTAQAEKWLREAEDAARRPDEWRTRARARLDRGVLLVKAGRTDEGQALLVAAERGGLKAYMGAQKDAEVQRILRDAEAAQRDKKVMDFTIKLPNEASPIPFDPSGELDPPRRPPPAPKMFEVLRF